MPVVSNDATAGLFRVPFGVVKIVHPVKSPVSKPPLVINDACNCVAVQAKSKAQNAVHLIVRTISVVLTKAMLKPL